MAARSTTNMISLLTLVMVTLPGLTSSFPYTSPWRDFYERVQAAAYPTPRNFLEGYVCCNQPPTPPSPRFRSRGNYRSMILTLAKRDDRYAPYRWLHDPTARQESRTGPNGRPGPNVAIPENIPDVRQEGGYTEAEAAQRREAMLTALWHVMRSPARHVSGSDVMSSLAAGPGGPRRVIYPASAFTDKRDDQASIFAAKRMFGSLGGPNMDWIEPTTGKRNA